MKNKNLKEKLLRNAKQDNSWMEQAKARIHNEKWQDLSFAIATRILTTIKEKGISQVQLADKLGVSPQMVNKIVKGKENLTLETISRIGEVLATTLIEVPIPLIKVSRRTVSHSERIGIRATRTRLNQVNTQIIREYIVIDRTSYDLYNDEMKFKDEKIRIA